MDKWFHAQVAQKILNGIYYVVCTLKFENLRINLFKIHNYKKLMQSKLPKT